MIILGIDPGSYTVGYGILEGTGGHWVVRDHGQIQAPAVSLSERLKIIHDAVSELMDRSAPDSVAVEEVFVSKNARTSLVLGHTRGVILLAAAQRGLPVAEYAARDIKQAVTGNGAASKNQVQWMMGQLLHLDTAHLKQDAADGLAAALCHGMRNDRQR